MDLCRQANLSVDVTGAAVNSYLDAARFADHGFGNQRLNFDGYTDCQL